MPRDILLKSPITIANTKSLSDNSVSLEGFLLVGIALPAAISGSVLSFQIGLDTIGPWRDFYQTTGAEKTISISPSQHILVVPEDFAGVPMLRVRTGTAGSPTVQIQDAIITLILRPI